MANTFPNSEEIKAIKILFVEEQKRHYSDELNKTIEDLLDGAKICQFNGLLIFEGVLDNLEKLRKRLNG